ncbi:MAG: hypothetical protein M5U09_14965 [Gammaproteobacteria bacterium]|nr:hypothetical protein [Gammaproteobacteria bacterium]
MRCHWRAISRAPLDQLAVIEHAVHQAHAQGGFRHDRLAQGHHLHGAAEADHAGQPLGAAAARNNAEIDLGQPQQGLARGHAKRAGQRHFEACSETVTVDAGYGRQAQPLQQERQFAAQLGPGGQLARHGAGLDFVDIGARGERLLARPGDQDGVGEPIALQGPERVDHLLANLKPHGVAAFRVVDGDDRDSISHLQQDLLVHGA